jgi:hypothetical protein
VFRWTRAALRFVVDQVVPVALTAALNLATRSGLVTLLPLTAVIEREYGNLALLLGCAAALVASATFSRVPFDLPAFVTTGLLAIVSAAPFILGRAGLTLALPSRQFDVVLTLAYVGFSLVAGLLIGGCWSVVVRALREAAGR